MCHMRAGVGWPLRLTLRMALPCCTRLACRVHERPPQPASLRIYEAHVGMAGEEPSVSTYAYFRDHVRQRDGERCLSPTTRRFALVGPRAVPHRCQCVRGIVCSPEVAAPGV